MLIVVEDRDLQTLAQLAFDLKTGRGSDVLEVDAAEAHADPRDRVDGLLDRPGLDHDGERRDAGEVGEEE